MPDSSRRSPRTVFSLLFLMLLRISRGQGYEHTAIPTTHRFIENSGNCVDIVRLVANRLCLLPCLLCHGPKCIIQPGFQPKHQHVEAGGDGAAELVLLLLARHLQGAVSE